MVFLAKKILTQLFYPFSLCLGLLTLGLLSCFLREVTTGSILLYTIGLILLIAFSYKWCADILLRNLERKHRPVTDCHSIADVKWIVVLGEGDHVSDPTLPATSQIPSSSLVRLVEGIRLHRNLPNSQLVLSGGAVYDPTPSAVVMKEVAIILGVESDGIVLEPLSRDTKEEAHYLKGIVGDDQFILVTSAHHMIRSINLFRKEGMNPFPAPTEYLAQGSNKKNIRMYFPTAENLLNAEKAFHEYFGLLWSKIRP